MALNDSSTKTADADAIQRTVESLRARNLEVALTENGEEAKLKIIEMLPVGAEVFKSTSETLDAIGFSDYLRQSTQYTNLYNAVSHETDPAKQREMRRQVTVSEYYIGSVQAIAETGEVIIASGSGSQLGAYAFGAKNVIWVAGTQKICPNLSEAIDRVRGYSMAKHDQWLADFGRGPSPMGKMMIFEHEQVVGRVRLVLIKENLGW